MGILSLFKRQKPKTAPAVSAPASSAKEQAIETPKPETSAAPNAAERANLTILSPVITEKAAILGERSQYAFRVAGGATKQEIHRAVEDQFGVHVERVSIMNVKPKKRQRARIVGEVSGYRKAIVSLRAGERIDLTA